MPILDVQTDNGHEFEGEFDTFLRTQHIPHHWSYPRCPRINGCIERYQRTLSEEFLQVHNHDLCTFKRFLLVYLEVDYKIFGYLIERGLFDFKIDEFSLYHFSFSALRKLLRITQSV